MDERQAKLNQLLAELDDHGLIDAALVVDPNGAVKGRVGASAALASVAGGTDKLVSTSDGGPKSNVYVRGATDDFLLVLFDDTVDFDQLKREVDELVESLEL
ncbi:MAG: hypothetical protein ACOCV2_12010 [Persicimonas sp.]